MSIPNELMEYTAPPPGSMNEWTPPGGDAIINLGDNAGANKVYVKDSDGVNVAYIDSDGNLTILGSANITVDDVIQGQLIIDSTRIDALVVRKDSSGGDVFVVDTTNSIVKMDADLQFIGGQAIYADANTNQLYLATDGSVSSTGKITSTFNTNGQIQVVPSTGTNAASFLAQNTGGSAYFGKNSSTGGAFVGTAYSTVVYSGGNVPLEFFTNDAIALTIGSDGSSTFGGNVLLATGKKLTVETIKAVDSDGLIFTDDGDVSKMTIAAGANGLITLSGGTGGVRCNDAFGLSVAPQAQQPHIVDADGTLADITTKFNTLLADLEGFGLLASA